MLRETAALDLPFMDCLKQDLSDAEQFAAADPPR